MSGSQGIYAVLLLSLTAPSSAVQIFDLNCTAPTESDHVNFVTSANVRSTMDIIWSCLSILLLCTWNAMHLSVPSHFEVAEKGWKGRMKEQWIHAKKKATWMFVMVMSPEYLFGKAMMEHFAAKHSVKMFNDKERWTSTHAYFANMRGLVLRFKVRAARTDLRPCEAGKGSELGLEVTKFSKDPEVPYEEQDLAKAAEIELEHCRHACHSSSTTGKLTMSPKGHTVSTQIDAEKCPIQTATTANIQSSKDTGAVIEHRKDSLPEHEPWEGTWALTASQWYEAYRRGIITHPPRVGEDQIKDRSKGDGLAKAIAILQISWLVVQVIGRAIEGLAITLLEVTVLAFAFTAIAIYITIWSKPQNVEVPVFIDADRLVTREDVVKLAARSPKSSMIVHEFWLHGVCVRGMADNVFPYAPGVPIPLLKDERGHVKHHISGVAIGMGFGGALFGAIHCSAFQFAFPSLAERTLWWVASIFIMATPMPCAFFYIFTQQRAKRSGTSETWTRALLVLPLVLLLPFYLFFRLYLMFEACRSLAYPAASTFQDVQWPDFIPHFG